MKALIDGEVIWKVIEDYPNYEVSNTGLVRSKDRLELQPKGRHKREWIRKRKEKILSQCRKTYSYVGLYNNGVKCLKLVHRLVAEAFIPNTLSYKEVNHKDGDKFNNNVSNLEWCNRRQNALHSTRVLKKNIGISSKLVSADVLQIINLFDYGWNVQEIADNYNVSKHCIYSILKGTNWNWLTNRRKEAVNESTH